MSRCCHILVLSFLFFLLTFPAKLVAHTGVRYSDSITLGNSQYVRPAVVATDSQGNVYLAGSFYVEDVDFNPGPGTDIHSSNGASDCYLTKFNKDGSYGWTKTWGGTSNDYLYDMTIDSFDRIHLVGQFAMTVDFDPSVLSATRTAGHFDAFLTSFNALGQFLGVNAWGGANYERATSVTSDSRGVLYVAGFFQGTVDFDPGPAVDQRIAHSSSGDVDTFVSRFDANMNYQWVRVYDTNNVDIKDLVTDSQNNLLLTGEFHGSQDLDPGAGTALITPSTNKDHILISKWDSAGNHVWTTAIGGDNRNSGEAIAVDSADNIYVAGQSSLGSVDFDFGSGTDIKTGHDYDNIFIMRINKDASYGWAHIRGSRVDYDNTGSQVEDLHVTADDTVYLGGTVEGEVYFDPENSGQLHIVPDEHDAFFSIFTTEGEYTGTTGIISSAETERVSSISSFEEMVYIAGQFQETVDLNTQEGTDNRTAIGSYDVFLSSYHFTHTLSGRVLLNGEALPEVSMAAEGYGTFTTDSEGYFYLPDLLSGEDYSLVPSKYGYFFDPVSVSSTFLAGATENFTAYVDACPDDETKVEGGICGCGVADADSDGDGSADCEDACDSDPAKTTLGACGCGVADTDSDGDGTADCIDGCSIDSGKTEPGVCGCGAADTDSDGDGTPDCVDACSADAAKIVAGTCGCGVSDADANGNGIIDCLFTAEFRALVVSLQQKVKKLKKAGGNKKKKKRARLAKKEARAALAALASYFQVNSLGIQATGEADLSKLFIKAQKQSRKALRIASSKFKNNKRKARKQLAKLLSGIAS